MGFSLICPVLLLSVRETGTVSGAFQLSGDEAGSEKDTEIDVRPANRGGMLMGQNEFTRQVFHKCTIKLSKL